MMTALDRSSSYFLVAAQKACIRCLFLIPLECLTFRASYQYFVFLKSHFEQSGSTHVLIGLCTLSMIPHDAFNIILYLRLMSLTSPCSTIKYTKETIERQSHSGLVRKLAGDALKGSSERKEARCGARRFELFPLLRSFEHSE